MKVDLDGITDRLMELPVAAGRYSGLGAAKGKLFYLSREETAGPPKLKLYDFSGKKPKETEMASGVMGYDLSQDAKKIAVRTAAGLQIMDAG